MTSRSRERGFSLLEVMVAAVLFSVVLVIVMSLLIATSRGDRPLDHLNATTLAEEFLETHNTYNNLDSTIIASEVAYSLSVSVTETNRLQKVHIVVSRDATGDTIAHYYTEVFQPEKVDEGS